MSPKQPISLQDQLDSLDNIAKARSLMIALLVKKLGGRATFSRDELRAFQGWYLSSRDTGDLIELDVYPPSEPVDTGPESDGGFSRIRSAIKVVGSAGEHEIDN